MKCFSAPLNHLVQLEGQVNKENLVSAFVLGWSRPKTFWEFKRANNWPIPVFSDTPR